MTSHGPIVSILIPAYNAGRWIEQTIRSALAQTWARKEIIVVDDGSTDATVSLVERFKAQGVVLVAKQNEGAAAARNVAMARANGDYIQWLDADDLLAPDKIERQLALLERDADPMLLLSGPWGRFSYRPYKAVFEPSALWADLEPVEWLLLKLGSNLHMQTATWLASRSLLEAAGSWDTRMTYDDDGEYFCRVLMACKGTRFEPSARVYWRDVPGARVSYVGTSAKKMEAMLLSMQLHIQYLLSLENTQRTRAACLNYIQNCAPLFHPARADFRQKLESMALELGGSMPKPRVRAKYAVLDRIFGETVAWKCQLEIPRIKARMSCELDRWLSVIDKSAANFPAAR